MSDFEAAAGAIWSSPRITEDFTALCACGGRFAGTESELRARELMAKATSLDLHPRAFRAGLCAQTGFALAHSYPAALVARVFVGMGDAMTWICLLRLVATWFAGRRIPFVTALSGTLGQLGAIGAAAPMTCRTVPGSRAPARRPVAPRA